MAQSLRAGICTEIRILKNNINNLPINEIFDGVKRYYNTDLYDYYDIGDKLIWKLKNKIISSGLKAFLQEQFALLRLDKEDIVKIMIRLWNLTKSQEIISFCKKGEFENLVFITLNTNIQCYNLSSIIPIEVDLITFLTISKLDTNNNIHLLGYLEKLIKHNNAYKISKAVKVFVV